MPGFSKTFSPRTYVTGGGAHDTTKVRDERGLAATVWPHKPKDRALGDGETHPVECRRAVEDLP